MSKRMRWERKRSRYWQCYTRELNRAKESGVFNEFEDGDPDSRDNTCGQCGGDRWIMLSEAGPGAWGEDCFCGEDEPIECPECRGKGVCV